MGGGVSSGPDGVVLATVVVLGLDNLVDGLVLANSVPRAQLEGVGYVDLRQRQAGNSNGGAAVTGDGIL